MDILHREFNYIWYYFTVQFEQIFGWWVLGMVLGSAVSVFAKDHIHRAFRSLQGKRLGVLGVVAASALELLLRCVCMGRFRSPLRFLAGGSRTIGWLHL